MEGESGQVGRGRELDEGGGYRRKRRRSGQRGNRVEGQKWAGGERGRELDEIEGYTRKGR